MNYQMNRNSIIKTTTILLVFLLSPFLIIAQQSVDIQVAPNVLNLKNQGEVVTIHTDIPFSQVVATTVSLNGVEIDHWKSDSQGYFVAKFLMSEIKDLPLNIGGYNTMTLTGDKVDGTSFTGSDEIMVINVSGSGRR
jgi:hypothetical protein